MLFIFYKYHGAGNDFIILDNRNLQFKYDKTVINRLCNRNMGIGADGLMTIEKDAEYDFKMRYFNADGLEGSMCGNGGRCIVHFAKNIGIINKKITQFNAIDGLHRSEILSENLVKLQMQDVSLSSIHETEFGTLIDTGSPHLICFKNSIDNIDVYSEGKFLRYDNAFKHLNGVNVNFVEKNDRAIKMRTYERGVEAETLACGTGSVAVALVSYLKNNKFESPVSIRALVGNLSVYFKKDNEQFTNVWLEGPVKYVFKTEIDLEIF